jgi:hypothetical protein
MEKRKHGETSTRYGRFYSANLPPMPVMADYDAKLEVGGLTVPITLAVVEKSSYDLILGMNFFRQADAVVDVRPPTISLFGSLTCVPMTTAG